MICADLTEITWAAHKSVNSCSSNLCFTFLCVQSIANVKKILFADTYRKKVNDNNNRKDEGWFAANFGHTKLREFHFHEAVIKWKKL